VRRQVTVLLLVVAVAVGTFFLGRWSIKSTSLAKSTSTSSQVLPLVKEDFTLLPCGSDSTLGMEGCEEHAIVHLDKRINASQRMLYSLLRTTESRQTMITAVDEWLSYRRSTCLVDSDAYENGSLAPIAFANCLVSVDDQRVTVLSHTLSNYGK
jgi:uncharacterized protein YecT (DUF1311 family)